MYFPHLYMMQGISDLMRVLYEHQSKINDICTLCANTADEITRGSESQVKER